MILCKNSQEYSVNLILRISGLLLYNVVVVALKDAFRVSLTKPQFMFRIPEEVQSHIFSLENVFLDFILWRSGRMMTEFQVV